jgi:hypothetical protein
VVSTTPRPLYPRERPGTHCTGGWVGRCGRVKKISFLPRFFLYSLATIIQVCVFITICQRLRFVIKVGQPVSRRCN